MVFGLYASYNLSNSLFYIQSSRIWLSERQNSPVFGQLFFILIGFASVKPDGVYLWRASSVIHKYDSAVLLAIARPRSNILAIFLRIWIRFEIALLLVYGTPYLDPFLVFYPEMAVSSSLIFSKTAFFWFHAPHPPRRGRRSAHRGF